MSTLSIPQNLLPGDDRALKLFLYRSHAEQTLKSQIDITQPLFSFLLEGDKQVHFQEESIRCTPDKGAKETICGRARLWR